MTVAPEPLARYSLEPKLDRLRSVLSELDRVVVAFSGGADSAFLAWVANEVLGAGRARIATAVSASLAEEERRDCAALAAEWGLDWATVATGEVDDPAYHRNDGDRCYWCKDALMHALAPIAEREGATVVLGVNVDDLGDHRPGQRAAREQGARFPLVEAGFTKIEVRAASRQLELRTWDKPAAACLASRLPYGTPVTMGRLAQVERAEAALHRLGFRDVRVRHYGDVARLELPVNDLTAALARRDDIVEALKQAGYRYATLDLEGLRSGNLNQALERPVGTEHAGS